MTRKNKKDNHIVNKILEEYDPKSVDNIQDVDCQHLFGPLS